MTHRSAHITDQQGGSGLGDPLTNRFGQQRIIATLIPDLSDRVDRAAQDNMSTRWPAPAYNRYFWSVSESAEDER